MRSDERYTLADQIGVPYAPGPISFIFIQFSGKIAK